MEFLDKNGLRTLWAQINNLVDSKSGGGGGGGVPVIDIGDVQTTTQGTLSAQYYSDITSAKMSFLKATTGVNEVTIMPLVKDAAAGKLYEVTTGKTTYSVLLFTTKSWVYTKKTASSGSSGG